MYHQIFYVFILLYLVAIIDVCFLKQKTWCYIKRVVSWISLAWPLLIPVTSALTHYWLDIYLIGVNDAFNKNSAVALQIVGGMLVLYSIDSNLSIFRGTNIRSELLKYFKKFPRFRNPTIINAGFGNIQMSPMEYSATGTVTPPEQDPIKALQIRMSKLEEQLSEAEARNVTERNELRKELVQGIKLANKSINENKEQVAQAMVGGWRLQVLGVGLVIHGSIVPLF